MLCTLFLTFPAAAAESFFTSELYWAGKKAYDKGDFTTAIKHWTVAAEQGVGEAQHFVGAMYHAGQAVPKDYKQAMGWYQKAAEQGVNRAQLGIGSMHADGHGVEKDYVKARMWFSIAEVNGNERAGQYLKRIDTRMTAAEIAQSEKMAVDWINLHQK